MSAQGEIWRVSTVEGTFEADLDTLKQWIVEGCVLPTDKVSKGTHNWIEAGRAPMLRAAFNGEVGSATVVVATTDAATQQPQVSVSEPEVGESTEAASFEAETHTQHADLSTVLADSHGCHNHPEVAAKFICRVCAETFCPECPKFIGSSAVPLCPLCGDLCRLIGQERARFQRREFQSTGFGFADFGRALRYPFQHKIALVFGALLYGFLLIAGFRGQIVAWVLMFGCIVQVINQVAWGKLDRSFLPDFSAFSLYDDLVVPIGLGIGIFIVTWGPAIAIALIFFFGVIGGAGGPTMTAPQQPADSGPNYGVLMDPNADPEKLAAENEKLNQLRPGAEINREVEKSKAENEATANLRWAASFLRMGLLLLPFFLLSVAWGFFYYPMALTVAGYTEHFGSVVNPLVGLDTIKRMRGTYFKAFGMVALIRIAGLVTSIIVAIVLAPFNMPFFGNLPANFVDGAVTFYLYLVIACLLGLALHKCADRLDIRVEQDS